MTGQLVRTPRRRYVVPAAAVAVTAAVVAVPQLASGQPNPVLPERSAAQLLAALEHQHLPDFSGTVVETTRLGLPNLPDAGLGGVASPSGGLVTEITGLLTGSHTAQIAYAGPDRQRVAIFLDNLTETDIVHNGADVWTYSSADNSVSHTVHSEDRHRRRHGAARKAPGTSTLPPIARAVSPQQAAEQALAAINPSTQVSVDRTAHVAGRAAYQLVLRPHASESLIGSVRIAIDATTSLPLRVQVWPRTAATSPAVQVGFTSLELATPAASTFTFTTPPGAVVKSGPFALNPRLLGTPHGAGALIERHAAAARQAPVPGRPSGPQAATSGPTTQGNTGFHSIGRDWLRVLVGRASTMSEPPSPRAGPSAMQQLTDALDRLANPVAGGRLLRTALVSVLLTHDGRVLIGAVTPSYLERLAAQGVGT